MGVFVDQAGCDPMRPKIVLDGLPANCRPKRIDRPHGRDPPILDPHRGVAQRRATGPVNQARAVEQRCLHSPLTIRRPQAHSVSVPVQRRGFCALELAAT
jgi:hypothetical protein